MVAETLVEVGGLTPSDAGDAGDGSGGSGGGGGGGGGGGRGGRGGRDGRDGGHGRRGQLVVDAAKHPQKRQLGARCHASPQGPAEHERRDRRQTALKRASTCPAAKRVPCQEESLAAGSFLAVCLVDAVPDATTS